MNTKSLLLLTGCVPLTLASFAQSNALKAMPNVVYIMADDLGVGDLGCYGQRSIKTPAIDRLAAGGMLFTQHYSGSTVSAPSRSALMTGLHTGHTPIRGNKSYTAPDGYPYDQVMPADQMTVAKIFKQRQYVTACIGKWGLGGPGSQSRPNMMGFDYFFGYLGQELAHNYYPEFLHENDTKVMLDKKVYTHDLIMDKALAFIENNSSKPFFLYLSPTIPHADLIVPKDEQGTQYDDQFNETPFPGGGYTACPNPRATFAAMVSRLDRDVQRVVDLLKAKGILENTIVVFTSDNGTHAEGGHDPYFFDSNGAFRGMKRDLYEGGIRTPFIASWPAAIRSGSVSYHVSAFWDFLPTVCDLLALPTPHNTDGVSYLSSLTGSGDQAEHEYLYFEFHEQGGRQAVIKDGWKLIRLNVNDPAKTKYELYNIYFDPSEVASVAAQYPGKVEELRQIMDNANTQSDIWPFPAAAGSVIN